MAVHSHKDSLSSKIDCTLSILDEIQSLSNKLHDINFDTSEEEDDDDDENNNSNDDEIAEARSLLKQILDSCHEANEKIKECQQDSEMIRALLGSNNLFLSTISMGLPPNVALKMSEVPTDTWLIRNLITELKAIGIDIADYDPQKAKQLLSKVWATTALGDQGELEVLKSLLDSGYDIEQIQIKPYLGGYRPDFYIDGDSLICDSKAYKEIRNINDLNKVVQKYSDLLPNGGEVRLYFPHDTYQKFGKNVLNQLNNTGAIGKNNVQVNVFPMNKTHSELTANIPLLYRYLSLI